VGRIVNPAVVLVGLDSDPAIRAVRRGLSGHDLDIVHWSPRDLLNDIVVRLGAPASDGAMIVGDRTVELARVNAIFTRQSAVEVMPEYRRLDPAHALAAHARRASAVLSAWTDVASCLVVNRPRANESNSAKALQLQLLSDHFAVPPTLVTNDPDQALAFAAVHRRVIVKAGSGERSIVTEVTASDIAERAEVIRDCPIQLQAYIPGRDVRVHVIGTHVVATEVTAAGTDFRYDPGARWRPSSVAEDVAAAAVALAEHLDLPLAGIDLRIGPDGQAVCFEVNPSPAFTVYEEATGQDITGPLCALLAAA
jgi:glutathione synthase/RimK-type ligase-like ATP-grasp enzyme